MAFAKFYQGLKKLNGKYCIIDGLKCKIVVSEYTAIYPYEHKAISAHANALNSDICFDLINIQDVSNIKNVNGGQLRVSYK